MTGSISIRPTTHSDVYISGDVMIEEGAAVASGVILRAAPGSQIIIKSAVCIGMGTIVNACGGIIEIGEGSILGANVLLVGKGTIGANACIGSSTTIFNSSIESSTVILAGSLIGEVNLVEPVQEKEPETWTQEVTEPITVNTEVLEEQGTSSVVGQIYINQLLLTLFPGRQPSP